MEQAPNLLQIPSITHGFFSRQGGFSQDIYASLNCGLGSDDDPANVHQNRTIVAKTFGLEVESLLTVTQTHSAEAIVLDTPWTTHTQPVADAIVTRRKKIAISICTADCGPLLFCDAQAGIIGATHAGWGGAIKGIAEATIDAMIRLGATPENITAAIGPCLQQDKFQVTGEFISRFLAQDALNQIFFYRNTMTGYDHFNMSAYLERRLNLKGITNIHRSPTCTYTDEVNYFSYRRATHLEEPDYGRQLAAIALNG